MSKRTTHIINAVTSAQRTSDGASDLFQVGAYTEARVYINITALSGTATPTLTVTIEDTPDSTNGNYYTHTASAGLTATGQTPLSLTNFARYIRVSWEITGTFSAGQGITFTVDIVFKT